MQDEGYIAAILYPDGSKDIPLGNLLAIVVDSLDDIPAFKDYKAPSATPVTPAPVAAPTPVAAAPATTAPVQSQAATSKPSGSRIFVSPIAQIVANSNGINLASVAGTGPNGRIIKADIEDAISSGSSKQTSVHSDSASLMQAPSSGFVDFPNSQIRKVIAERLTFSKQNIPHYYVTI